MTEVLVGLFAQYKVLYEEIQKKHAELSSLRRTINEGLDQEGIPLLVCPSFKDWRDQGRFGR